MPAASSLTEVPAMAVAPVLDVERAKQGAFTVFEQLALTIENSKAVFTAAPLIPNVRCTMPSATARSVVTGGRGKEGGTFGVVDGEAKTNEAAATATTYIRKEWDVVIVVARSRISVWTWVCSVSTRRIRNT